MHRIGYAVVVVLLQLAMADGAQSRVPFASTPSPDGTFTNEFPVDTPVLYRGTEWDQNKPDVAFGDSSYLFVWFDEYSGSGDADMIRGTRMNAAGVVLDTLGITISNAPMVQTNPCVAFDGTNYLVVWEDYRTRGDSSDIYGARVTQGGVVLEPNGFLIESGIRAMSVNPDVAFDGTNFWVVWQDIDWQSDTNVLARRVSPAGVVLDPLIQVSVTSGGHMNPAVTFGNLGGFVTWADSRNGTDLDIKGSRVLRDGSVVDPTGLSVSSAAGDQYLPKVAFGGGKYLVSWIDERHGDTLQVYAARLNESGVLLDPTGIRASSRPVRPEQDVVYDGANFLCAWDMYGIFGTRLSVDGVVLDTARPGLASPWVGWTPRLTRIPGGSCIAAGHDDIWTSRVAQSGAILDSVAILLSLSAAAEEWASVASDGTDYMVVWQTGQTTGRRRIYGIRLGALGSQLDSSSITIDTSYHSNLGPTVAFGGQQYLVAWANSTFHAGDPNIFARRVNRTGAVLDSAPIVVSDLLASEYGPAAAYDGTNFLIVWSAALSTTEDWIYGARVRSDGVVIDTIPIPICEANYGVDDPSVTFGATDYLVTWSDQRSGTSCIYASRLSRGGTVLEPAGIPVQTAQSASSQVASNGTDFFVVWQRTRDIYGARVSQSGDVLDPLGIPIATSVNYDETSPSVTCCGDYYLVTWEDKRNDSTNIYGARVSSAGTVVDTFAVVLSTRPAYAPASCTDSAGRALVAFEMWSDRAHGYPCRTPRIWGTFYPDQVGVSVDGGALRREKPTLAAVPNPFHGRVVLSFGSPVTRGTTLRIYDAAGCLVRQLRCDRMSAQTKSLWWDGRDDRGRELPGGVYCARLGLGERSVVCRMTKP